MASIRQFRTSKAELKQFRRSRMMGSLFKQLPPESQKRLGKRSGASVPGNKKPSASVLWKHYGVAFSENLDAVRGGLDEWYGHLLGQAPHQMPDVSALPDGEFALFCILSSTVIQAPAISKEFRTSVWNALERGPDFDWSTSGQSLISPLRAWHARAALAIASDHTGDLIKRMSELCTQASGSIAESTPENRHSLAHALIHVGLLEQAMQEAKCQRGDLQAAILEADSRARRIVPEIQLPIEAFNALCGIGVLECADHEGHVDTIVEWDAQIRALAAEAKTYQCQAVCTRDKLVERATAILASIEIGRRDSFVHEALDDLRTAEDNALQACEELISAIVDYVDAPSSVTSKQTGILEDNLSASLLARLRQASSSGGGVAGVAGAASANAGRESEGADDSEVTNRNSTDQTAPCITDDELPAIQEQLEAGGEVEDEVAVGHNAHTDSEALPCQESDSRSSTSRAMHQPKPNDLSTHSSAVGHGLLGGVSEPGPDVVISVKAERPSATSSDSDGVASALADLIGHKHFCAAHLFARANGPSLDALSWALESLIYGFSFRTRHTQAAARLSDLVSEMGSVTNGSMSVGEGMLIVAAYIRPTLMSDQLYTVAVLQQVKAIPGMDGAVLRLVDGLIDFANRPPRLDGDMLIGLDQKHELLAQQDELHQETQEWIESAPAKRNMYQTATFLWQSWVRKGGALRKILDEATRGSIVADDWARESAEWRELKLFRRKMDQDTQNLSPNKNFKPVRYRAEETLHRHVCDLCDLVDRWNDYHARSGTNKTAAPSADISVLEDLKPLAQAIVDSMEDAASRSSLNAVGKFAIAEKCKDLIGDFSTRDDDDDARRRTHPDNFVLFLPEVDPDAPSSRPDILAAAIEVWKAAAPRIIDSIKRQLEYGRIAQASMLAERFLRADDRRETEEAIDKSRRDWISRMRVRIGQVLGTIQKRELEGVLGPAEDTLKQRYESTLNSKLTAIDSEDRFDRVAQSCSDIERELDVLAARKRDNIMREIPKLEAAAGDRNIEMPVAVTKCIENFINEGSLSAASELIGRTFLAIEEGDIDQSKILPQGDRRCGLVEFFKALPELEEKCHDLRNLRRVVDTPEFRANFIGLDAGNDASRPNGDAVKAWEAIAAAKGNRYSTWRAEFFEVLGWLGYQAESTEQPATIQVDGRPYHWTHYRLAARVECPLPRFGSAASNRIDIVIVWGKPAPEAIAQWFATNANLDPKKPVLVLHMSVLGGAQRRATVHALRRSGYGAVIVDVCLLAWLSLFDGRDRTHALFGVTLAGILDNPYTPDVAGAVPPEMFFGRAKQVQDLWDKGGPCIVYGGRQLGKSALLKKVQRTYHNPKTDCFVFYEGLGPHVRDVWERIRSCLIESKLLSVRGLGGKERIAKEVRGIFESNPAIRILFLLDECDTLLDQDAKLGFTDVALMRDLMTDTERRFKVVLAGLHNVQRFQRLPNQPLAHFGEPVCIGPLDPGDARDLVAVPTAALGYQFQPESLVERILAMTNRHPSLLQLFCFELISELGRRGTFRRESTPPFVIEENDIGKIFKKVNLANRMRDRFEWTLDLDPRYRVLGYTFADLAHEGMFDNGEGLPVQTILDWASSWWPGGFAGVDDEELRGLLDEMIGLGVLVGDPISGYKLRSPNVLQLLGGADSVRSALKTFEHKDAERKSHPGDTRRWIDQPETPASPLTVEQEGRLFERSRGVGLIAGSGASGLDHLDVAIRTILVDMSTHAAIAYGDISKNLHAGRLLDAVKECYGANKSADGIFLHARLTPETPLDIIDEMQALLSWIERERTSTKWLRVLFVSTHEVKRRLEAAPEIRDFVASRSLRMHALRRWSRPGLKQWFDHASRQYADAELDEIMSCTGGWSGLLLPVLAQLREGASLQLLQEHVLNHLAREDLVGFAGVSQQGHELSIIRLVHEIGEAVEEGLLFDFALERGVAADEARRAFEHLEDKGLLRRESGKVLLDPVIGQALAVRDA